MSRQLVQLYQKEIANLIKYGGTAKESAISGAFERLLNQYCRQKDFLLVPQLDYKAPKGKTVIPDGTVKDALRLSWGYWEAKDTKDNLDEEIAKKFDKGYPKDNILFEDSITAVLIQAGVEVERVLLSDDMATHNLLTKFLNYERPEVRTFREAIENFRHDLPGVVESLRTAIAEAERTNIDFDTKLKGFVVLGQSSINPDFGRSEAREMMIQHILTEDIFNKVFDETQFHHENNIAHELGGVIETFFKGPTKRDTLERIRPYFEVINAQAAGIASHKEKQKFLKVVYENFYKAYNPKVADRLGIVYTPNEVVRFMIEGTEYLTNKHFDKLLGDKGVEILDPATGTGTFITELLDYLPLNTLAHKYKHELYANEVSILPYYIANLNIEYTYKQLMGSYEEFNNICFVDTLDNVGFQKTRRGQLGISFGLGAENAKRIKRQNMSELSVIIGNPPYNANQKNENDNNKNRKYPDVDKRIKETYVARSESQKTKVYDPYARFFRWATDRLADNGVLTFITNSSFIHKHTFDGFRKVVADEFTDIYLVDLGGSVRDNGKLSGTKHNVFGIQAGVAIGFFIKKPKARPRKHGDKVKQARIHYLDRPMLETAVEKLNYLHETKLEKINFTIIKPDVKGNWLGQTDNDWDNLLPLISKRKAKASAAQSIFYNFCLGVSTNRDKWVYDFNEDILEKKVSFLADVYAKNLKNVKVDTKGKLDRKSLTNDLKWSSSLLTKIAKKTPLVFNKSQIIKAAYRPFVKQFYYSSKSLSDRLTDNHSLLFGKKYKVANPCICFSSKSSSNPFRVLATDIIPDLHFTGDAQLLPLYWVDGPSQKKESNITAWGITQFVTHYGDTSISGEDIFHYTYAVLHDKHYCAKYAQNLKRDFPRLPFYPDFKTWVTAGAALLKLHLNYETATPYPLSRIRISPTKGPIKTRLKANAVDGTIQLTDAELLSDIPAVTWRYKVGNRSALEWILDQYKEVTPNDPTIAEHFDTYRYINYVDQVSDLIARVTTVSIETMKLVDKLAAISPLGDIISAKPTAKGTKVKHADSIS
jgi:predicted helicase